MSYKVQIAGNELERIIPKKTSAASDYDIKLDLVPVIDEQGNYQFDKSGVKLEHGREINNDFLNSEFNILLVTKPQEPNGRKVETILTKNLLPLLGNADEEKSYYATMTPGVSGQNDEFNANGFNKDDYENLPKINEGNIPYLHGELIRFGKIPFDTLPTDGTVTDQETILTQRGALNTIAELGRALTADSNGNLVLLGYKATSSNPNILNTELIPISKAKIQSNAETPIETLTGNYPR